MSAQIRAGDQSETDLVSATSFDRHGIREQQHKHDYTIGVTSYDFSCDGTTSTALLGKAYITSGVCAYPASSSRLPP